jgi:hypothetical protein
MIVRSPLQELELPDRTDLSHRQSFILLAVRPYPSGRSSLPVNWSIDLQTFETLAKLIAHRRPEVIARPRHVDELIFLVAAEHEGRPRRGHRW